MLISLYLFCRFTLSNHTKISLIYAKIFNLRRFNVSIDYLFTLCFSLLKYIIIYRVIYNNKTRGLTDPEIKWVKAAFNPMPDKNCILID